jgi:hypothetical protein
LVFSNHLIENAEDWARHRFAGVKSRVILDAILKMLNMGEV